MLSHEIKVCCHAGILVLKRDFELKNWKQKMCVFKLSSIPKKRAFFVLLKNKCCYGTANRKLTQTNPLEKSRFLDEIQIFF